MRQVEAVLATQDGVDALVLCSDGGVVYSNHQHGVFTELSHLAFDSEEDCAWAVRRVGAQGHVVLLRAARREGDEEGEGGGAGLVLRVDPLQSTTHKHRLFLLRVD